MIRSILMGKGGKKENSREVVALLSLFYGSV